MPLNEYQIKRQSTKNAIESTVSLGEKYWVLRSGDRDATGVLKIQKSGVQC